MFANRLCEHKRARFTLAEGLIDMREHHRQRLDAIRTAHAAPEFAAARWSS